jgi:hypothetical protein
MEQKTRRELVFILSRVTVAIPAVAVLKNKEKRGTLFYFVLPLLVIQVDLLLDIRVL